MHVPEQSTYYITYFGAPACRVFTDHLLIFLSRPLHIAPCERSRASPRVKNYERGDRASARVIIYERGDRAQRIIYERGDRAQSPRGVALT